MTESRQTPFVGVQIAPHSLMDEGVDYVLDFLQETAGVNALVLYPWLYYGLDGTIVRDARDPHTEPADAKRQSRTVPMVWFKTDPKYYGETTLRHWQSDGTEVYAGTDIIETLTGPCQARGIELHLRILDPCWGFNAVNSVENWGDILAVDYLGAPLPDKPCYRNPNYRAWYRANLHNLYENYELDGFKFGVERGGPLQFAIFMNMPGHCFCEHCQREARDRGIDVERARRGFAEIHALVRRVKKESDWRPEHGLFFSLLGIIFRYPELVAWEKMWLDVREDLSRENSATVKSIAPEARYGVHLHHPANGWGLFERAMIDYSEMAQFADWIKPSVYPEIAGPRLRQWIRQFYKDGAFAEFSESGLLDFTLRAMGLDPAQEPSFDRLAHEGLSPNSVAHETQRIKSAVAGQAQVYAGLGFDVPWWAEPEECQVSGDPEVTYQGTKACFEAGADGILLSREYDEMQAPHLQAAGRAIREFAILPQAQRASTP